MKTDSVVNLAALAALCGTAGVAGYYNQQRKRDRDADRVRKILDGLKEQEEFNKEAYCRRYFMRKEAAKLAKPTKGTIFSETKPTGSMFHPSDSTKPATSNVSTGLDYNSPRMQQFFEYSSMPQQEGSDWKEGALIGVLSLPGADVVSNSMNGSNKKQAYPSYAYRIN